MFNAFLDTCVTSLISYYLQWRVKCIWWHKNTSFIWLNLHMFLSAFHYHFYYYACFFIVFRKSVGSEPSTNKRRKKEQKQSIWPNSPKAGQHGAHHEGGHQLLNLATSFQATKTTSSHLGSVAFAICVNGQGNTRVFKSPLFQSLTSFLFSLHVLASGKEDVTSPPL